MRRNTAYVFAYCIAIIALLLSCAKSAEYEIVSHWEKDQSHVYSVYTKITDIDKLQAYSETMPYTLGKNTTVCFFKERNLTPDFSKLEANSWTTAVISIWKSKDFQNCTAWYDRLSSGDDRIVEDPPVHLADSLF